MTMAFNEKTFVPDILTNWNKISRFKFLSEEFINRYRDYLDWNEICLHQKLSRSFIIKYIRIFYGYKLNFPVLRKNMYLSPELKREIKMWGYVHVQDGEDFFEFRERIEDRQNAI